MGTMFGDHVIWITGGGSGIGRALALEFARQGGHVAVSGRRVERLHEVVGEIEQYGRSGLAVACDVTDEAAVERAVQRVCEQFGRVDVAVANAGYGVGGRFARLTTEQWRRQLDVNVVGVATTARCALPHLQRTRGRLALVSSVAGMVCYPGGSAYCASKFAVRAMGWTLSLELHGSGVSCTTVFPGFVETEINQVDNEGQFHPDREDKRPSTLMWSAERAARVCVRAIYRRRREFVFTGHGKLGGWLGRHLPGLAHFAMTRGGSKRKALEGATSGDS